jgi:DNA-binding CsgD family transcriptional regulator
MMFSATSSLLERGECGLELIASAAATLAQTEAPMNAHAPWPTSARRFAGKDGAPMRANRSHAGSSSPSGTERGASPTRHAPSSAPRGRAPGHELLTGIDALTPSERRVAELAARGHTNAEIAQRLFIALLTLEGHLTHANAKLEIHGRGELALALSGQAPA